MVEKAGKDGLWKRDIKMRSGLQEHPTTKILRKLEGEQLIKSVKTIYTGKTRPVYMLYELSLDKKRTGGPWYTANLEFDHEFVDAIINSSSRLSNEKNMQV